MRIDEMMSDLDMVEIYLNTRFPSCRGEPIESHEGWDSLRQSHLSKIAIARFYAKEIDKDDLSNESILGVLEIITNYHEGIMRIYEEA